MRKNGILTGKCWVQRTLALKSSRHESQCGARENSVRACGGRLWIMRDEAGELGHCIPNHDTWPSPSVETDPLI